MKSIFELYRHGRKLAGELVDNFCYGLYLRLHPEERAYWEATIRMFDEVKEQARRTGAAMDHLTSVLTEGAREARHDRDVLRAQVELEQHLEDDGTIH